MNLKGKKISTKSFVVIALCCCLVIFGVGGVWAYLTSRTDSITNVFVPAEVACSVEEEFNNGLKSNVKVRNTGNVESYIRATVIATFVTSENKVLSITPTESVHYSVTWANTKWAKGTDGFWYYPEAVSPSGTTTNLIESAFEISAPEGCSLNLQIIATAIQSDPAEAVQNAWGIAPTNGKIIPN